MTDRRPADTNASHAPLGQTGSTSFNQTKFLPPVSLPGSVVRSKLIANLDAQAQARIVLLLAPAGYGKTTLMCQWMAHIRLNQGHVSWLTLDESDNDPVRLVRYLNGALQTGLDHVASDAPPLTLFIDEFEKLTDPGALHIVKDLFGRLPRSVRLVLSSRDKSLLELERYRVRGELIELSVDSLRFDSEETTRFLNGRLAWQPAPWQIDQVQTMTDGWPAALQLTALATRRPEDLTRYTTDLAHGLPHMADYLAEDVLKAQPPEVRSFLLETCSMPRLSAQACDSTTGRADSKRMLQYLVRHGLFTSALDTSHNWFRYHPLFAEFLQNQQAIQVEQDRIVATNRAAASWFSRHGTAMEAVDLWLLAGDTDAAVDEMSTCARELMIQAQFGTILRWMARVDAATLKAHGPQLTLAAAWAYGFGGQVDTAMHKLAIIQAQLHDRATQDAAMQDELIALEAALLALQGETTSALRIGLAHWARLGAHHDFAAGALANAISYCLIRESDFERARQFCQHARLCNEAIGSALGLGYALSISASIEALQGHLNKALEVCAEVDKMASVKLHQPWFETAHVKVASISLIASILYEQDRLDDAQDLLQRHVAMTIHQPSIDMQLLNLVVRSRINMAHGDVPGALATLDQAVQVMGSRQLALARRVLDWERVRIGLISGDAARALVLADVLVAMPLDESDRNRLLYVEELYGCGIESVRYLIGKGDAQRALAQVTDLIASAQASHRRWRLLKLKLLRALALDALGDRQQAQAELIQTLDLGLSINARRSFADEGSRVAAMLAELPLPLLESQSNASDVIGYWRALRCEFSQPAESKPALKIDLTERESSILKLMATGLGNEPIASQLCLSVNTVKWHIRRILEKLDARNRNEAVFIARQGGLVNP